jgi:hypothetical protein
MKKKYLALAINFDNGSVLPMQVATNNAQKIADALRKANDGVGFQDIYLIHTGKIAPCVMRHFSEGNHFDNRASCR